MSDRDASHRDVTGPGPPERQPNGTPGSCLFYPLRPECGFADLVPFLSDSRTPARDGIPTPDPYSGSRTHVESRPLLDVGTKVLVLD